jgi:hypothetical protein
MQTEQQNFCNACKCILSIKQVKISLCVNFGGTYLNLIRSSIMFRINYTVYYCKVYCAHLEELKRNYIG